jgi:CDP-diacylglycerol---serine O-phosphatidyltransferase
MDFFSLLSIPNILTLINLFAGCMAVVFIFNFHIELVPYCVAVSLVADFFDGFAARFFKSATDIGKQLDSLADVISFGLVPGLVLFQLLFQNYSSGGEFYSTAKIYLYSSPAFLVTLFAALRLGKFNVDTRQTDSFLGLATPAATIFIIGVLLVFLNNTFGLGPIIFDKIVLYAITLTISALMVSEIPMFAFKFKSFGWKGNEIIYLFIILSVVLLATLKFAAISLIVILYVLVSIIKQAVENPKAK